MRFDFLSSDWWRGAARLALIVPHHSSTASHVGFTGNEVSYA